MNLSCTRRIQWCSGHRVLGHEGKCNNLHGHNYEAEITCEADHLDSLGRVIDFSVIKSKVGNWIEREWDHRFILWSEDQVARGALDRIQQPYHALDFNPTAENIARTLIRVGNQLLEREGIHVVAVVVHETPNCFATVVE